jgi:hypothetical protein
MKLTFKMAPEGVYDLSTYIVAATSTYSPDGSKGLGFKLILNIPDALRGTKTIVVRLDTESSGYWGSFFFDNN